MDIVPIQLSLTEGDLITLWAPMWREGGEEWEGFLGDEDGVHAFPDAGLLTAYVRTVAEHDLSDHPAWPLVLQLAAAELVPSEDQCYDVVGVPEIAAEEPDTWTVGELAGIVTIVRSLADACDLDRVHEVLNSADGFAMLDQGAWAFTGREGGKLWQQLAETVAGRWDEVIDALDRTVLVPEVDQAAVAVARTELAAASSGRHSMPNGTQTAAAAAGGPEAGAEPVTPHAAGPTAAGPTAPGRHDTSAAAEFWEGVGIDPVLIGTDQGEFYTLRCYLDDRPLFLGADGRILAKPSARALAEYLGSSAASAGHDLTRASTWPEVLARAEAGELVIEVDPQNVYQLSGLGEDLADGPGEVDPSQLDLGVELLLDVGVWADDDSASVALSKSQSLGWLTSFVLQPDPTRLAPGPPFDAESGRWNELVATLLTRLRR